MTPLVEEIRAIGGLDLAYGPWVAGGAARCVFEGTDVRAPQDIDYFSPSQNVSDRMERLVCSGASVHQIGRSSHQTVTISGISGATQARDRRIYQIVRSRYCKTLSELLSDFDLTVAQFATDGHHLVYTADAADDARARTLRYANGIKPERVSIGRLVKYMNRGFSPGDGVIVQAYKSELLRGKARIAKNGHIYVKRANPY